MSKSVLSYENLVEDSAISSDESVLTLAVEKKAITADELFLSARETAFYHVERDSSLCKDETSLFGGLSFHVAT
jgi:hypothetical protein